MASSPKRFYTIHSGRQLYESIDLESIVYAKLVTGDLIAQRKGKHRVKISHKIILSNGITFTGDDYRKAEGGKPLWPERLIHAWQKYRKQQGDL
jgi:hypothetical protein